MGQPHHQRHPSLSERMRSRYKLDTTGSELLDSDPMCLAAPKHENEKEEENVGNIIKLIQEKDKDLLLAAELGKALLDKNEEISHHRERIVLDYTQRLEVLSQEKYLMSRQLERLEDEYQQEVTELQAEIEKLKRNVEKQRKKRGAWDRDISDRLEHLTQENLRLAQEVRKKGEDEKKLFSDVTGVNTELCEKSFNVQEHCDKIEQLNKNILEVNAAKKSLESEIETISKTVETLTCNVEHSSAREKALERKLQLQDHSLLELEKDCEKLRTNNLQVLGRLEKVSLTLGSNIGSDCSGSTTLMQEIESFVTPPAQQQQDDSANNEEDLEEDSDDEADQADELRDEVIAVYEQIRNLVVNMKRSKNIGQSISGSLHTSIASSDSGDNLTTQFRVSQLNCLLHELDCLIQKKLSYQCLGEAEEVNCHQMKLDLEVELHQTKLAAEQTELRLKQVETESKQKLDQLQELKCKLVLMTSNLAAAVEERDMFAADILDANNSKDVIIKNACDKRDEAVEAKNEAEVDLAKNRIELMQVNSQLLDTVQHKLKLAEQLEEMEVNIVDQIQDQVRDKLEKCDDDSEASSDSTTDSESGREKLSRKLSRMIFGK